MEIVPFAGWEKNARLVCNDQEMIVTLEVGPRILSYGFIGGPNLMAVHEKTAGQTGGDGFISYGGHRLWIAPEIDPRTFQPDNSSVEYGMDGDWAVFTTPTDAYHIQKEIRIKAEPSRDRFLIRHRIYNRGAYPVELAPWSPTQFAPGGVCIFPQPEYISHNDKVLPARPLVLWHYTNMSDPRWTWGERVIRLQWMDRPATKVGSLVQQGYVGFALNGSLHLRRFDCRSDANYGDYGCNFETFTRQDMLEVETVGPLQTVAPGDFAEHDEAWYLLANQVPPADDAVCGDWLKGLAGTRPLS